MTTPRPRERHVQDFAELTALIRSAGLLRRRYRHYAIRITLTVSALAAVGLLFRRVGDSWWQLAVAGLFALVLTQFGFLGHDAAHHQIFASPARNVWTARILSGAFAGLSHAWWNQKHNRHHRAPNQQDRDPDIGDGVLLFDPRYARGRSTSGLVGWFTRRQGYLFFPLLLLEGVNLHLSGVLRLVHDRSAPWRRFELAVITVRLAGYPVVLLGTLPPGKTLAFLGVQLGLFGLLLGGAFAPNHKGMPIIPRDARLDFLRRQVLVSRNIRGGRVTDLMMGGLNYQIEHHLFPRMPSPNLRRAQPVVQEFCRSRGVPYASTTLPASYGIVIRHLNEVGLRAGDPSSCPVAARFRP